ncbi:MAG TPA: Gfo/Idh/MocA family oxidoreductase [Bacteroidales bacterium]|nr:Gfo/Idh/MocA family oxidoreductase [Bacteroidales bacterium]
MEQLKWGILGCGSIANKFAEALQKVPDSVPYAAAARDKSRADAFATKWNFQNNYGSYSELVSDNEVDIIYIATPHSYHFAHTKLCLEAGKHVLCEKPFTINSAQLKQLIAIAKQNNRFLMEALWSKFLPGIIKVKQIVEEGLIGDPKMMYVDFGLNFPSDPKHRLNNPHLGGGSLLDLGIYPLFMSLHMFGKPMNMIAHSSLNNNKIDLNTSIITESKNGTISHLSSTMRAKTPVKATLTGTEGSIEFDSFWFTPVGFILNKNNKESRYEFPTIANGYEYEIIESAKCIAENKLESDTMPHSFSLMLMEQMDKIRKITGISYPVEIESVEIPYGWDEL